MKNPFKWLRSLWYDLAQERDNIPETPEYEEEIVDEIHDEKDPIDIVMDRHLLANQSYELKIAAMRVWLSYCEMLLIMTHIEHGKLVNAIKELRACTGLGLKESKYLVDNLHSELKEVIRG